MKPIHKICGTDDYLRPAMSYFQVKDGFVWATNSHILVKMPVNEILGDELVAPDEELYFSAKMWQLMKMSSATIIARKENEFINVKTGLSVTALTAAEFAEKVGRFPDCASVVHDEDKELTAVTKIAINPKFYLALCEAIGELSVMYFYGETKGVVVKSHTSKGFGLIMPLLFKNAVGHPFKTESPDLLAD